MYRIFYLEKKQIFVINDTVKSKTSEFFKIAKTLVLAGLEGCNLIKNGLLPAGIEKIIETLRRNCILVLGSYKLQILLNVIIRNAWMIVMRLYMLITGHDLSIQTERMT